MSHCHDDYAQVGGAQIRGEAAPAVEPVGGTQCHDVPETTVDAVKVPGLTVLIAESDPTTRTAICRLLEDDRRFGAISRVPTGDEALTLALEADVVVVDLRSVRGLGALGTINRIARRSNRPPIVGLARHGEEWLSAAARCEGADDIVEWPEEAAELNVRLLAVVRPVYA